LRLGEAIKSFQNPDRMVLGVDRYLPRRKEKIIRIFKLFSKFKNSLNVMSLESAEMVKHALNSFSDLCCICPMKFRNLRENRGRRLGCHGQLKQDSRVGPKAFLRPGLGFAGGTSQET